VATKGGGGGWASPPGEKKNSVEKYTGKSSKKKKLKMAGRLEEKRGKGAANGRPREAIKKKREEYKKQNKCKKKCSKPMGVGWAGTGRYNKRERNPDPNWRGRGGRKRKDVVGGAGVNKVVFRGHKREAGKKGGASTKSAEKKKKFG